MVFGSWVELRTSLTLGILPRGCSPRSCGLGLLRFETPYRACFGHPRATFGRLGDSDFGFDHDSDHSDGFDVSGNFDDLDDTDDLDDCDGFDDLDHLDGFDVSGDFDGDLDWDPGYGGPGGGLGGDDDLDGDLDGGFNGSLGREPVGDSLDRIGGR